MISINIYFYVTVFIYSIILSSATVAPQVTVHPVDQTNIVPGSDVSFSVTATGTEPLSYQWQKDGVNLTDGVDRVDLIDGVDLTDSITGATTATLTIAGVIESDEGGYRCVVTNTAGMDTSNTAVLTVGKKFRIEIIFSIMMLVVDLVLPLMKTQRCICLGVSAMLAGTDISL